MVRGRRVAYRRAGLVALLLVLIGCASSISHDLPHDQSLSVAADWGVVVGSVGARPTPGEHPWAEWSRYDFHALDDPSLNGFVTSAFRSNPFSVWGSMPLCDPAFVPTECRRWFALRLPAGEYTFSRVMPAMMSYVGAAYGDQAGWSTPLPEYRFTVRPGRVVYLGHLLSRICVAVKRTDNAVLAAVGRVTDEASVDLPRLRALYPALADQPIDVQPLPASLWRWRYREAEGFVPRYGWPVDCSLAQGSAYLQAVSAGR